MHVNNKSSQIAIVLALILVGLNLRPSISSVAVLMPIIQQDVNSSSTLISLLTTLPFLAIGLAMFSFRFILKKFNVFSVVAFALLIIGLSSLCRLFVNQSYHLLITAVVAGCGIAIIQAILPIVIKKNFASSLALYMGLYVTAIMGGDALASALTPIIKQYTQNWHIALACWSILAIFALAIWLFIKTKVHIDTLQLQESPTKFYQIRRAWLIAIFFGLGSASYTCVLAWLPSYFVEHGFSSIDTGLLQSLFTLMQVLSGLIFPALSNRSLDRRPVLYLITIILIIGYIGLIVSPTYLYQLWVSCLGLGIGGLFTMTLITTMDHYADPIQSGELSVFVQGTGYIMAAFSPLVAGLIRDITNGFSMAWSVLLVITFSLLIIIYAFNPKHYAEKMQS